MQFDPYPEYVPTGTLFVNLGEVLAPLPTVTSTFCEFLIHPGLFWRFSGKDAERLVGNEHDEADLLRG